jgi:hypothetical protein
MRAIQRGEVSVPSTHCRSKRSTASTVSLPKVAMEAVGYIKEYAQKELENSTSLAGAENIYAAAFYLGLEVRKPVYELNGNLYVDDFSHPLHNIDKDEKCLITTFTACM